MQHRVKLDTIVHAAAAAELEARLKSKGESGLNAAVDPKSKAEPSATPTLGRESTAKVRTGLTSEPMADAKGGDADIGAGVTETQRLIAQGAIRKALGLQPSDLRLGLDVARNHLQIGAVADAFRIYAALVVCDPSDPELQVGLANCALHVGEHNLALQAASAIVALTPSDPRGYFFSGSACFSLGHIAEAKEDLAEAIELARRSKDALICAEARKILERITLLEKQRSA